MIGGVGGTIISFSSGTFLYSGSLQHCSFEASHLESAGLKPTASALTPINLRKTKEYRYLVKVWY